VYTIHTLQKELQAIKGLCSATTYITILPAENKHKLTQTMSAHHNDKLDIYFMLKSNQIY